MATLTPADHIAINALVSRYFWLVDHGRAGETAALFSPAATLTFAPGSPKPGTLEGTAIAAAMAAREKQTGVTTRHVLSNVALTPREDGAVEGYLLLTLFRSDDETRGTTPAAVADIEDLYVRAADGWRIERRLITPIFNRA